MIAEEHERREMDLAARHAFAQLRKPLRETRRRDPPERRALAHVEALGAVREHRRIGRLQIEPPLLDLDQVTDNPRNETIPLAAQRLEITNELVVGKFGELHASFYTRLFLPPSRPADALSRRGRFETRSLHRNTATHRMRAITRV